MTETEPNAWWNTLRHEGVLVSPIVLDDWLPDGPHVVEDRAVDKLRQHYYRFADDATQLRPFLDAVLEEFLGHSKPNWRKEHDIPDRFKHQGKKPNRVLLNAGKEHQPRFIVLIDDERVADESGKPHRLGLHSGRRKHADLLRLMRATDVKLGVLTNGHHFRLVYGGMDHESWAEWSADAWFQGGDGRTALHGLFTLLGAKTLAPDSDSDKNELLVKVQESRDRQADLSHVMGTQIREAVELLMEELTDSLTPANRESILAPLHKLGRSKDEELQSVYQGAIRCIMRLIVQLYAESRALLPKQERLYYESYSVEGLYQMLKRAAADGREEELRSLRSAWPRLLASWRAIHDGSIHKDLQIQIYGGQLFRPHVANPEDTVLAAIAVLEDPRVHVSDWAIREILEKLRVGKYKVGRGKWRKGPVDFSDLRTEYIGMMYEGLLDYDLREARQEDGGIVFLSIGDQPALPLNVLAAQQPEDIKRLIKEQSKKNKGAADTASEGDEAEGADVVEELDDEPASDDEASPEEEDLGTADEQFQAAATKWAVKAVELGGLFGCTSAKLRKLDVPQREKLLLEAAHKLVLKAIPPGGMYLVRWSGTRKGSGTFYTKPGLAVPTTVRTLEPLVYENHEDRERRIVKRPEEILALKVCDPAMGSGSFLVAALRFLAGALKESFETYVIPKVEAGELKATETGETAIGLLTERILRTRHEDHSGERMESALKRAVVEHCIYGVDLNPLAVELGKLSLWIETMDPTLRFTFLDHKIKCGNGLIGAWKQQAEHYPLAAWDREAGDGKNNPRTARIKRIRKELVLPELKTYLDGFKLEGVVKARASRLLPAGGQQVLLGAPVQASLKSEPALVRAVRVATQTRMDAPDRGATWDQVLEHEMDSLARIHANPNPAEQEQEYEALLRGDGRLHQKYMLDKWCAVWFWPVRAEDGSPLQDEGVLGPREFYADRRGPAVHEAVKRVAAKHRFFHWELEYPEVFAAGRFGFDGIIGNPPWETNEAKTQELFVKFDPAFRTLAGQGAKSRIKELTTNPAVRDEFWDYSESFLASKNFFSSCHNFMEGLAGKEAKDKWLALTQGTKALPNGEPTPYARVKGKQNLYVLFAEHALSVSRQGGMIGLIAPSGLFSDNNTRDVREAYLENNTWEWIYCFENRRKVFPIHAQFKFAAYIIRRGGRTEAIRCWFMEPDVASWGVPNPARILIRRTDVVELSPSNRAVVEIQDGRDLLILRHMCVSGVRLGGGVATYVQGDFNTTLDADKFCDRQALESSGYAKGPAGTWHHDDGSTAYPLYEGRMPGILQFVKSAYVSGRSRAADWRAIAATDPTIEPQYLVRETACNAVPSFGSIGVSFINVTSATNTRTVIATLSPAWPHNHAVPKLVTQTAENALALVACLSSYAFDFAARRMTNGTNLPWATIQDFPIFLGDAEAIELVRLAQAGQGAFAPAWAGISISPPASITAVREELDDRMGRLWGLSHDDMRWILRPDNADPRNLWRDYRERLKILEAAGLNGKWYTLEEAREIRRKAGMAVDF